MQDYGKALRILRRHHNLTQKEIAEKLNVTSQTVSKWENGVNQIDITYIQDLCSLFGISVNQFLSLADGQSLESVLNGTAHPTEPAVQEHETTPSFQTGSSPDPAVTAVDIGVNPHISPVERTKTFIKTHRLGVISAIVLLFIVIAVIITAVCVTATTLSADRIYEKVNPSVFYIEVETASGKSAGSGFFIDKNGTAVTNYHVVKGGVNAKVTLPDGSRYDVEEVLGCDTARDLVLLKVDIANSVPVARGDSNQLKTGDKVYAIGYPESFILGSEDSTFTDGIISKPVFNIDGVDYIQTTADMTNGNSGGVLINSEGKVVGITTGRIDIGGVTYMNLALPVNNIGSINNDINLPLKDFSSIYKDVIVTYMAGDDIHSQKTVANGALAPEESGERYGFTFEGWFNDSDCLTPFDFNAPVDGDTTVYGKWTPIVYTVVFSPNGGEGEAFSVNAMFGESIIIPDCSFTCQGYSFEGWSVNGNMYAAFESVEIKGIADDSQTITFNSVWQAKEYIIRYVIDLDDGVIEKEQTCRVGESVTLLSTVDELPAGYVLSNWYIWMNGTTRNFSLGQVVTNEDIGAYGNKISVYADWSGIIYYVECIDGITGESYGKLEACYAQKIDYDRLKTQPDKPGYKYTWQLYNDDGTPYTGKEGRITTEAGKTVVAKTVFEPITYSISFKFNTSDDGYQEIGSRTLTYDEEYILSEAWCFSKPGYTFQYYKNTGGTIFVAGDVIKNLTVYDGLSVSLYAIHSKNNYSIAFDSNGGSGEMPVQAAICADEITINANTFVKEGYYFKGWTYGEQVYSDGGAIKMYLDEGTVITLVAQWGKNLDGEGTELSPYKVANYDDLVTMSYMVEISDTFSKAYYVLTADIDCQNQPIKPIGGSSRSFKGTFDGQNHIISNLKIVQNDLNYMGLFGKVYFGALKNFGLKNYTMTGANTARYCGAIAGEYFSDKPIENVYARGETNLTVNVGTSGSIAAVYVGGMFGTLFGSASNCYYEGKVAANATGRNFSTNVTTGGFAGKISGTNWEYDGVNYSISPNISCCYIYSPVTVNSSNGAYINYKMGGFVGEIKCTSTENVTFEYCVSIGDVKSLNTSNSGYYGGFAGINSSKVDLSLVRRDSKSVYEGGGTVCSGGVKEDLIRLQNVQWLTDEFGFSADIWADEYGLPMLKAYIKETE